MTCLSNNLHQVNAKRQIIWKSNNKKKLEHENQRTETETKTESPQSVNVTYNLREEYIISYNNNYMIYEL